MFLGTFFIQKKYREDDEVGALPNSYAIEAMRAHGRADYFAHKDLLNFSLNLTRPDITRILELLKL